VRAARDPAASTGSWHAGLWEAVSLGARTAPAAFAGLILLTATAAATPVVAAWLTKVVLDRLASGAATWPAVAGVATALVVAGLAGTVQPHLAGYLQGEFGRRVSLAAQDQLYRAVNGFAGLRRFEDPAFLDRLRTAQHVGLETPGQVMAAGLATARAVLSMAGFLVSLVLISPSMAGIVLLGSVPAVVAELRLARSRVATTLTVTPLERREVFYANLLGDVRAAKEVRLFGTGDELRQRMRACRTAINARRRQMDRRTATTQGVLSVLSAATAAAGLLWVIRGATTAAVSIGDVSMFMAAVAAVQSSVGGVAFGIASCHQHLLILGQYRAVYGAGSDLPAADPPRPLTALRHAIELRDVWFRYSPDHPWVLRGVNFAIPYGQSTALVGLNGVGKSTLVKLLCRFYDPTRGTIRWDGVDIRAVRVEELRSRLTAIFQDFVEYDMTAAENIALGDLRAGDSRDRVVAAATRAGIHDKIEDLPRGYDTMLSRSFAGPSPDGPDPDDGVVLSGGQWQRLALARTLLRERRDLLILDEPSAGLDAEAEHEIHIRLREHRAEQTSLLISHRLSAVRAADTIVVLAAGAVVERGTHDELMAVEGRYARMFALQARGYQPADESGPIAAGRAARGPR